MSEQAPRPGEELRESVSRLREWLDRNADQAEGWRERWVDFARLSGAVLACWPRPGTRAFERDRGIEDALEAAKGVSWSGLDGQGVEYARQVCRSIRALLRGRT